MSITAANPDFDGDEEFTPEKLADLEKDLQLLRERAEAGDREAQRELGCAYFWGEEFYGPLLKKDLALCRHWYVQAAEQGHTDAMWDVAHMLLDGEGGPPDLERGLRYLHFLASRRRYVAYGKSAAEVLSCCYHSGNYGLPADPAASEYWFQRVSDHRRYERGYDRKQGRSYGRSRAWVVYADGREVEVKV
jgi:TPR repeat protein